MSRSNATPRGLPGLFRRPVLGLTLLSALACAGCASPGGGPEDAPGGTAASGEQAQGDQPAAQPSPSAPPPHQASPEVVKLVDEAREMFDDLAYKEALAKLDEALAADPAYDQAYLVKGKVLHANSDYEQALAAFNRALELNPKLAEAWDARGMSHYWNKQVAEAIDDFTQALELEPERYSSHYYRGSARAELKDYDGALEDLHEARRLLPDGDDRLESVDSLIARAEELKTNQEAEARRRERMEALRGGAPDAAGDDGAQQEEAPAGEDPGQGAGKTGGEGDQGG